MSSAKIENLHGFLRAFIPALTRAHQYTTAHQQTVSAINAAYNHLVQAIGNESFIAFMIIDDRIVFREKPLDDALYIARLVRFLKKKGIQHLRISRGVTIEEMTALVDLLSKNNKALKEMPSFPHIQAGSVGIGYKTPVAGNDEQRSDEAVYHFGNIREKDLALMMEVYHAVRKNQALPHDEVGTIVTDIITTIKHESSMLVNFSALRILDEYTFTHSTNVCILTLAQAMALGIKEDLLHDIGIAALLHDAGKIFVPEEVLNKQGKLTEAEWRMIRQHPQRGAEYLLDKPGIPALAVTVAYEHHMHYNFSGYPEVPEGWRQNICSQMTTISDIFDALRTKRIYRDAMEMEVIAEKMDEMSGSTLHPVLAKNFLLLMKNMVTEAAREEAPPVH